MASGNANAWRAELARLVAGRNRWAERFASEVEFAEGLAKLVPDKAKRWAKLIADASAVVAAAVRSKKLDRLEKAVT